MEWDYKAINTVIEGLERGNTFTELAKLLGTTRNTIAGKVFRLKKDGLVNNAAKKQEQNDFKKSRKVTIEAIEAKKIKPKKGRSFASLFNTNKRKCQFELSHLLSEPVNFCGKDCEKSGVYCEYHEQICWGKAYRK